MKISSLVAFNLPTDVEETKLAWFRRVRAARVVAIPIASSDLLRSEQTSLFLAGFLAQHHGYQADGLVVAPYGSIDDVGFAAGWADPLSSLPPRNMDFCRGFYSDRFFHAQSADCSPYLARVEIKERLVEDTYMRGPIDYTGFEVNVTFSADAYAIFAELVEIERPRASSDFRGFVLSIPTPPFPFPAQRGSPDPDGARIEHIKELRPINRLEVRDMVIARADRRTGAPSDSASILDRFQILSATKLTLGSVAASGSMSES